LGPVTKLAWNATRQLRQSSIRRWRLWSFRDWASYALLALVLAPFLYVGYLAYSSFEQARVIREVTAPRLVTDIKHVEAKIPFDSSNVYQWASSTSADRANVTFRNMESQDAVLYWIDLNGSANKITTIRSGHSATVETFVGHLWEARTQNGDSLGEYVVEAPT
jgi:von Hippel-Lindau disease tumor suppressor protein